MSAQAFPVRVGRFWFKWRSVSPLPWVVLMLLLPAQIQWNFEQVAAILGSLLFFEGIRILAVGYAGSATRTRGDNIPELVCAGPYRWLRNPLYVANIGLYTTLSLLFGFKALTVIIFFYFLIQYIFIVSYEESRLVNTFGESYENYQRNVPQWIPQITPCKHKSRHRFDLAKSLRSERSTLLALSAILLLFAAKKVFL